MAAPDLFKFHTHLKTIQSAGKDIIWCAIRKKYLVKTPEEWVRQLCIIWLQEELKTPAGLISIERNSGNTGRFDLLAYDRTGSPLMLIECKSPDVKISEQTALQWAKYNAALQVPFGLLTNGLTSYSFRQSANNCYEKISIQPSYPEMTSIG